MDDIAGLRDLRRLRLVGVLAPVAFIASFEAFRIGVIEASLDAPASNIVAATVGVLAALGFGVLIFFSIDRAQRALVRRSRDLAIVNRVAAATQGELNVEVALKSALQHIVDATSASEAAVSLHPVDPDSGADREMVYAPAERAGDALTGPAEAVELPLTTNGAIVGRLRLQVPMAGLDGLPAPEALRTIADQLGTTLHIGQLVADLHSRRADGHVFYQALLQTSNQAPLADALSTIVEGARERLQADEARVCLTGAVLDALELDPESEAGITGGIVCRAPAGSGLDGDGADDLHSRAHACLIGRADGFAASLRAPLWVSGEQLGDIWVARSASRPFTPRDHGYLMALAGIATIAISGARARQQERQGAILAERDRIARELHDSLAQVLGSTHLRLRHVLAWPALAEQPRVAAELESLADVAEEAYRDVREAILGLRETSRTRGFLEAIRAYVDKYAILSGIEVRLETSTSEHPALAVSSEIQVLRVIQEALTNVRKHAQARTVRVVITDVPGDGLVIVIEDDGRGFDPSTARVRHDGGYGLQTMRERMELAGGSLRVDSSPNRGTRVIARVPVTSNGRSNGVPVGSA